MHFDLWEKSDVGTFSLFTFTYYLIGKFREMNEEEKIDKLLSKLVDFWCDHRDLNPDGICHTPLKRTRLPVPPWSQNNMIILKY